MKFIKKLVRLPWQSIRCCTKVAKYLTKPLLAGILIGSIAYGPALYVDHKASVDPLRTVVQIRTAYGSGSGTIIKCKQEKSGFYTAYVLTAAHLFQSKTQSLKIILYGDHGMTAEHPGEIVFWDYKTDIAYVKVPRLTYKLPVAKIAPLDNYYENLKAGDKLYGIGGSLGLMPVKKEGLLNWKIYPGDERKFISTNIPLIFGDSGGGIFNKKGELIGVINALMVTHGHPYEHINLCTPMTVVAEVFKEYHYNLPGNKHDDEKNLAKLRKHDKMQELEKRVKMLTQENIWLEDNLNRCITQNMRMRQYIAQLVELIKNLQKELANS